MSGSTGPARPSPVRNHPTHNCVCQPVNGVGEPCAGRTACTVRSGGGRHTRPVGQAARSCASRRPYRVWLGYASHKWIVRQPRMGTASRIMGSSEFVSTERLDLRCGVLVVVVCGCYARACAQARCLTPAVANTARVWPLTGAAPSALSIASSRSVDSSIPEAAALAWTCSGREAPVIAEASSLRRSTQASPSPGA